MARSKSPKKKKGKGKKDKKGSAKKKDKARSKSPEKKVRFHCFISHRSPFMLRAPLDR